MGIKRQQVNPKRLSSDYDLEAESVLGQGDKQQISRNINEIEK